MQHFLDIVENFQFVLQLQIFKFPEAPKIKSNFPQIPQK